MLDPAPEDGLLTIGERSRVIGDYFLPKKRFFEAIIGGDGGDSGAEVESQSSLSVGLVMALQAFLREEGPDVPIKGDGGGDGGIIGPRILFLTRE